MDRKTIYAFLIVLLMIGVTWALLTRPRVIRGGVNRPVALELPAELGPYQGDAIRFCHNDQCLAQVMEADLADPEVCPRCGGQMDRISLGETLLLPSGTPIIRKRYTLAQTPPVDVAVVFSGMERRSIHRPQVCLTAQGQSIQNEIREEVQIPGREPLRVRLLGLYHAQTLPDGREVAQRAVYAYWFFNPERETDDHFARLVRMAFDNIFRNYRPRWAYVMVSTRRLNEADQPHERIRSVIRLLDPLLQETRRDMAEWDR